MEKPPADLPIDNLQDAIWCEWRGGVILCIFGNGTRAVIRPVGTRPRRRRSWWRRLFGRERRKGR